VKVRGFRVELGEVEAALGRHESVGEAVVAVARAAASEDKRIVAYVVGRPETKPRADELLGFLRGQLPEYMLPSAFVVLDALPLLPNGKINRGALPPPPEGLEGESAGEADAAPRDELERTIADAWREVLGGAEVGIRANFFSDLGGHSLLAVQAVLKLRERLGPQVSFVDMFQFPTVSALAEHWRGGADGLPSRAEVDEQTRARQESARRRRRFKQSRLELSAE
jgi:acyl carrier protein